ncbi:putative uncharacterized protein [Clostridium sp. CAG:354]|nr:putative uncharacterized protein [Clostridium sp. CAG:354]
MNIQQGYFYFISDLYFDRVQDKELLQNKESGTKRPAYYCFKDSNNNRIFWFVPISSRVEKYKKIYNHKIQKQKNKGIKKPKVDTIVFGKISGKENVFLIQNMFPVIDKYIIDTFLRKNALVSIDDKTKKEINLKANTVLSLVNKGIKSMVFPDILKLKGIMKDEILKQLEIEDIFNNKKLTFIDEFKNIISNAINKEDISLYLQYIKDSNILSEYTNILNSSDDITKIKTDIILKTDELFNVEENSDEESNEDEV